MIKTLVPFLALIIAVLLPPAASAAAPVRILALGDSLTAGYGLGPDEGFTTQLEKALRAKGLDVRVINAGVSGDTAEGGLARLDWALGEPADAVIVELGANNMLRGMDPAATQAALDAILSKLAARKLPVLLAGMRSAPNLGADYQRRFDAIYPELAAKWNVPLYPFFLDGAAAQRALIQPDGLHPNAAGVAIIVARMLPAVMRLVAAAEKR